MPEETKVEKTEAQVRLEAKITKIVELCKELQVAFGPKLQAGENGIVPVIAYYDQEKYEEEKKEGGEESTVPVV